MGNGVFGKQAIGSADGVFSKRAMSGSDGVFTRKTSGCTACAGFGAASPKKTRRAFRGFGAVTIPSHCWDTTGFKDASDSCILGAQQAAADEAAGSGMSESNQALLESQLNDACHQGLVEACNAVKFDKAKSSTTTTTIKPTPTTTTTTVKPVGTKTVAATPVATEDSFLTGSFWGLPTIAWIAMGGALALVGVAKVAKSRRGY